MDNQTPGPGTHQPQDHQPVMQPAYHSPTPPPVEAGSTVRTMQRASAWILIISGILFALIGILSVWGAFGDNNDIAWKSIASLSIIALAALVVNVGARIFEGKH